ncbi:hypothetical protein JMJ35_000814 [Cladonia borealis]|uniref:Uncharacterized protein n=1 Tax=Cladonia borealis TaxID=184061 RepID=A0AA39R8U0_9LECA|nr:hypothetical protein JMJ35_000814 [Cladonia borealis]
MVHSPQTYSPAKTPHGAANATMSHERQNGVPKRRPVQSSNTQSTKWAGRVTHLPKLAGQPAISGLATQRADRAVEAVGVERSSVEGSNPTPVKPFLSSNITPRSGSRKARAETASPVPNGTPTRTPNVSRPVSSAEKREMPTEDAQATSGLGLRIASNGRGSRTGSVISDAPSSSISSRPILMERNSASSIASPDNAPKFFHADDVKASITSKPAPERSLPPGSLSAYTQPNDENVLLARTSSFGNSSSTEEQRPKFFYANDANESKSPPLRLTNGSLSHRPPLQTIHSAHNGNSPPRAPSPLKEEMIPQTLIAAKPSPRRHTRLVSNGNSTLQSPQAISSGNGNISRRASLNSPKQPYSTGHARSTSVNSAGPSPPRKMNIGLSETDSVQRKRAASLIGVNSSLPRSATSPTATQELSPPHVFSPPQSPTKAPGPGQSKIDHMNELAANARRERKVLDLEISNSSLLAINRTLEREMRKQTAELRRFRRLSRSGRLSVAPSRAASGKKSMFSENAAETNDRSSLDSDEEGDDDMEDMLSNLSSTSAASRPSSTTAHAAHDRFQDPKRIELDLAAHRALLQDSQKLNTSIKRCLEQSENLLESGKRALAYHAEAPEAENLGPRVLTLDEVEHGHFGQGQGLLSPSLNHVVENPWERSLGSLGSLDAGLKTPEDSQGGPQTELQGPLLALTDENVTEPPNEPKALEAMESRSKTILPNDELVRELDRLLPTPEPPEKYRGLEVDNIHLKPNLGERRVSSILSLDGLEDEPDIATPARPGNVDSSPSHPSEGGVDPASFVARAGRGEGMRSPDPKPGEAGFRGSMQGLGHYLQTFSLFGPSQQA